MLQLHTIKPNPGAKHRKKRLGNGESSGLGKTCAQEGVQQYPLPG